MTSFRFLLGPLVVLAASALSCDAATGGREVRYELETTSPATRAFRTSLGWQVTLGEACVSLGPIYVFSGAPTASLPKRFHDWLVPSAHAHPGVDHFAGGEARGEWLSTFAADALRPLPVRVGPMRGPAGEARTVSLYLSPPLPTSAGPVECLRGHQAYVVGTAEREGVFVPFEGGLDIADIGQQRRIQVPVVFDTDDDIRVQIVVDPRPWLDEMRFDELAGPEAGARALITPESQARAAWFLGIQRAQAFGAARARE